MRIVHIAESDIGLTGGMARVVWHWKLAFERRGHEFRHIGKQEVINISHPRHFPKAALSHYHNKQVQADILLVHEPSSGIFAKNGIRNIVVSHGLERRGWQIQNAKNPDLPAISLKTRLLFPIWRLRGCDIGLRSAAGALLLNQDDRKFAISYYGLKDSSILVFKNGVNLPKTSISLRPENAGRILFVGTWNARKGIRTLSRAARTLHERGVRLRWVLAGTGLSVQQVLKSWPDCLHSTTEVIPWFSGQDEQDIYQRCNIYVLPSFFEGQPLALLQAMACGRCCVTTNICGQKDVVQDRFNGLLFEPGDALKLAMLLEEVSSNLSFQKKLGEAAHDSVKNKDWSSATNTVVDFVEKFNV